MSGMERLKEFKFSFPFSWIHLLINYNYKVFLIRHIKSIKMMLIWFFWDFQVWGKCWIFWAFFKNILPYFSISIFLAITLSCIKLVFWIRNKSQFLGSLATQLSHLRYFTIDVQNIEWNQVSFIWYCSLHSLPYVQNLSWTKLFNPFHP